MKKSKFLLLGSVASLASIPFVAAKCGETKEEEKKKPEEEKKPEPDKNPGGDKNPGENKTPGENTDQGKNPGQNTDQGKNPETDTTPANSTKIDLSKLESNIQDELSKLAKNDVSPEKVLNVLKKVKGLEKLTLLHFSTVEFKDNKLTVKAIEDSNLITGKYEFTTKPGPGTGTNSQQGAGTNSQQDAGTKPGSGAGTNSQQDAQTKSELKNRHWIRDPENFKKRIIDLQKKHQ